MDISDLEVRMIKSCTVGEILQKVYPKSIRNKGLQVISSNNIGHKTKTICAMKHKTLFLHLQGP